jgi:hypothetical protein
MTPHVVILTPSRGQVSLGYRDTFAQVMTEAQRRDREGRPVKISVLDETTPGLVHHSRNILFGEVVRLVDVGAGFTHAFWWDSDIAFFPRDLFTLLERPEGMICRAYPMRGHNWDGVAALVRDMAPKWPSAQQLSQASLPWMTPLEYVDGQPVWSADKQLVRVHSCGFGWVLFGIDALIDFWRHWAGGAKLPWMRDVHTRSLANVFDLLPSDDQVIQGEDVSFCDRWRAQPAGGEIWAAPWARVSNGDRVGCFADYLAGQGLLPPSGGKAT